MGEMIPAVKLQTKTIEAPAVLKVMIIIQEEEDNLRPILVKFIQKGKKTQGKKKIA